jgi:hypothetical protein
MRMSIKILLIISFSSLLFGCQKEIELEAAIRRSNRLIIGQDIAGQITLDTIQRGSSKWKRLLEFGQSNNKGWSSSVASYNFDYWTGQGTFRLSGWKNGSSVVFTYSDSTLKTIQLTKEIPKGDLDFLIK